MFNYYDTTQLIKDLDIVISANEKELEVLRTITDGDIMTKVKIQQLQSEINEMRVQRTYYSNKMADQYANNCVNGKCSNGCCPYKLNIS